MIRPDKGAYPLSQSFNDPCCRKTYQDNFGMTGHNGLDIAIPCGKPLYASHSGKTYHYTDPNGYGLAIFITGGGYESVTAHMSRRDVGSGVSVKEGQQIGLSGTTGFSFGCHCHFGVRPLPYNRGNGFEGYVDPTPLLTKGGQMYDGKTAEEWYRIANDWHKRADDRQAVIVRLENEVQDLKARQTASYAPYTGAQLFIKK